jgi:hypothetical protein
LSYFSLFLVRVITPNYILLVLLTRTYSVLSPSIVVYLYIASLLDTDYLSLVLPL